MYAKLIGTGSCLPERILTNEEIANDVNTSDAWISERTGIRQRHIAKEETVVSLAAVAARRALDDAGVDAEQIDLLIVTTVCAEQTLPCAACQVQAILGAKQAVCFDLNAACSGFLTAYQLVTAQMMSGMSRYALVISSETLSRMVDWKDRNTCILFGDGAGAAVFTAAEVTSDRPSTTIVMHADGSQGEALTCDSATQKRGAPRMGAWTSFELREEKYSDSVQMEGKAIYRFATRQVPKVMHEVLQQTDTKPEEIDYYILHQANERIITAIAKRMGVCRDKFPMNMMHCGNMSSASIPVLLDELNRKKELQPGMKLMIAGFGAGLTWGAAQFTWK